MITFLILTIVVFASVVYLLVTIHHGYWRRKNVPGPAPTFFAGNIGDNLRMKKSMGENIADIYRKYKKYPFVGIYQIFSPSVLVIDPDVLKEVLIKDFATFGDNSIPVDSDSPLFGKSPFALKGQEWKRSRQQLTPLLSNTKVKSAIQVFNDSAFKMINHIKGLAGSKGEVTLEPRNLAIKFTASNVASWGLGIDARSFEDDPSEFFKTVGGLFQFTFLQNLQFLLVMVFPLLRAFIKIRFLSRSLENKVQSIILETMRYRAENKINRNDFLSALLAMKEAGTISVHQLLSHVGALYTDGIETTAMLIHLILYEVAAHAEVQEKLEKEIDETFQANKGEITFDTIQGMKYLDAVFNEVTRLHVIVPNLDKSTTKRCNLSGLARDGRKLEVILEAGTSVIIPTFALHMDESYFPDPTAFKPERFLSESKDDIPKCVFMPFGEGPRACPGKTFATYQTKIAVIYLIRNFNMSLDEKTRYPLIKDPASFFPLPKEPIKLKFKERK